ncbi:zinc finger MYM-type protein 1-like [Rhopalosiphum padi]|uniref:zinc finger MYM-type protein 1-like n=1 Tax=Rhopalosiphum padi TaxID=40932 RepID=UPI00298ECBA7|nr:zinc finger MYM-type protein 1-like [Rhopalosiphum padi]
MENVEVATFNDQIDELNVLSEDLTYAELLIIKKIMKRVYLSGAAKKKAKNEKKLKEDKGKRNLHDFGWCTSSRNLAQNDINEQQCDIDDPKVLENEKTVNIHVGESIKSKIDDTVVPYPKEINENVINTQNNEVVKCIPMNENESVKELDKNVIDSNIFCSKGIIEANYNKQSDEMFKLSNDPATWKKLSLSDRDYLAAVGPPTMPSKFPHDEHENRSFPISLLQKTLPNKETVKRDWLVWSTLKNALFCFPCCLFLRDDEFEPSGLCRNGIENNWRKLYDKIDNHEGNTKHIERYLLWKDLVEAINGRKGIDKDLQVSINTEKEKWRKLLRIVVDITLFLAENNLPFRGIHSTIDHDDCGLFISTAKLVSHYSETMKNHLDTIKEYKDSDGTPDVSHKEQLVFVIRYVFENAGTWDIQERFLTMVDYEKKTGADIANKIEEILVECNLDLALCRGQGYDNAANMSGKYNGVKSKIIEKYPQALFSPCSAHSLNLCGVHAMETSLEVKTFFGNIQKLYNFFSCSPSRWKILQETAGLSLHSISATRWSARIDAVRPLSKNYSGILNSLVRVKNEINLPADNHAEAVGLISWLHSFEFILLTTIWYKVLQCIDDRNKILQSKKTSIDESSMHFQQLATEIQQIKDSWNDLLLESKSVASTLNLTTEFKITSRVRRKKHFHDDISDEQPFHDIENKFKVEVFVTALDRLLSDIYGIQATMEKITNTFSSIINPPDTEEPSAEYFKAQANIISSVYPNDVCANVLKEELRIYFKIHKKGLQNILPQICICLRILSTIPTSVSTGERSFSKLKLIKSYLRSTTAENHLNHLILLSIEHKLAKTLDYDDIIDSFAEKKARKKVF